jgi:hypothetical protein
MDLKRNIIYFQGGKKIPWPESVSELYRPSDRRLSAKLVPTFADDRGCYVVSVTDPYGRILGFLDRIFMEEGSLNKNNVDSLF